MPHPSSPVPASIPGVPEVRPVAGVGVDDQLGIRQALLRDERVDGGDHAGPEAEQSLGLGGDKVQVQPVRDHLRLRYLAKQQPRRGMATSLAAMPADPAVASGSTGRPTTAAQKLASVSASAQSMLSA